MINRKKKIAAKIARFILLAIFLIAAILPLFWIFVTSIKDGTEIYTFPLKYWPDKPSLNSYRELFSDAARALGRHPLLVTVPNFLLRAAGALGDMLHRMGISTDLSKSNVTMLMINNHYNATKAEKELGFKAAPIDFRQMLSCNSGE